MYDNIYTNYAQAKQYISTANADTVILELSNDEKAGQMSAEKYAYLSKAYIFTKDDNSALKYALKSVKSDKSYVYGYVRVAFAYARLGDKKLCKKYTDFAENLNPHENDYMLAFIAVLYNYLGDTEKAESIINQIKAHKNNSADYFYYLGFIYSQEKPEEAIKYLKQSEELGFRDEYNLWSNLAENYSLIEDYDNLRVYTEKCLELTSDARICELRAYCSRSDRDYDSGIKYLRRAYKYYSDTDDKVRMLAFIAYYYGEERSYNNADKIIKFAEKNYEENYTLCFTAASLYEDNSQYEEAIKYYKGMSKFEDANLSTVYSGLSYCYSQLEDLDKALEYVNKALRVDPDSSYAFYRKGRIYSKKKDYESAIKYFKKSIDYDKTDVDSFQWISYCYSMLKEFDKSLEYANRAILLDKTDSYSYFRKAWAYQEMERYDEAISFYKDCIQYNDQYIDAYLNISYIYSKLKDVKQSLLYANKALLINKDYAYAHYRKAWALQESGRIEEAYDGYSQAIKLEPNDVYNYLGVAWLALNNNENASALEFANKAIFIDKSCGGAYYYKSLALGNMGRQKEAEAAYSKAIKLGYSPA